MQILNYDIISSRWVVKKIHECLGWNGVRKVERLIHGICFWHVLHVLIHILFDLNLLCSYIRITCIYLWPSIAVMETENTKLAWSLHIFVWVISYLCQGVAYAIDRIMANCSIIPIMNASFDTSINVSVAANKQQFVIKMKSPQDLFYIDNNYTYAGQVTKGFWYISYFRWL